MIFSRTTTLTLLTLITVLPTAAQTYKNLIFEGGGIRGVAYAGVLRGLETRGMLDSVGKAGGTSAGAIAALLVSLRYSAEEIKKITYDTKLQRFNDGRFFFFGGISRMNRNYGWYRGKAFTRWLEDLIEAKTGNGSITFAELHNRGFRDLYVTGTSLNNQKLIVFSYEKYPDMKVSDAVRISMSIPLYFEAVFIDSAGHVVDKKKTTGNYDIMVDGGLTGNFPIFIFDEVTTVDGKATRSPNPHTLGIRIDTNEQIAYDTERKGLAPIRVERFKNYVGAFYNYVIENLNRYTLTEEDWKRTVAVSSGNINPRIKKLSVEQKDLLVNNGINAINVFLQKASK